MVLILMGVSGSGKTTIGRQLADELGWQFYDGDDYHPQANIDKMSRGIPLNDDDREPWLNGLRERIHNHLREGRPAVVACSALKRRYRELLLRDNAGAQLVYLRGDYDLILKRMTARTGHYMKAGLLKSQFEALEEPEGAMAVDISQEPEHIVGLIKRELGL
jgi:gluconokinase